MTVMDEPQQDQGAQDKADREKADVPHGHPRILALANQKAGVGKTYWNVARKYGTNSTPEQIEKAFSEAFKYAPPLAFQGVVDRKEIAST